MFSGAGLSTGGTHERRWRRGTGTATASRVVLVSKRAGSLTRNSWRTSDPILFCLSLWPGRDAWTLQAAARGNPAETQQVPARRGGRLLRGLSCSPPFVRRWDTLLYILLLPPVLHHHHQHNDAVLIMRPAWPIDRRNDRAGGGGVEI